MQTEKHIDLMFTYFDTLYKFQEDNMDVGFKRNYLRFFFIQIDNFLKTVDIFKKELHTNSKITTQQKKSLNSKIRTFENSYDSRYDIIRDKISAHNQEIDLLGIVEWWNEIDFITIKSFYDEIIEIKQYIEDNSDIQFTKIQDFEKIDYQNTFFQEKKDFYLDNGRLGVVSQNSISQISMHNLQEKHQLIQSIINFLKGNLEFTALLNNPQTYYKTNLFNISWHLIITDYISFIDNLFKDIDNKYVKSDNLIKIWGKENISGLNLLKELKDYRENFFEEQIKEVRNKFSAHIDSNLPIEDLNELFDKIDLEKLYKTIQNHVNQYLIACKNDIRTSSFSNPEPQKLDDSILAIAGGAFKNYN